MKIWSKQEYNLNGKLLVFFLQDELISGFSVPSRMKVCEKCVMFICLVLGYRLQFKIPH